MGVLHGDAGIDLKLKLNYWTIKINTNMLNNMDNYKCSIIYFYIHIVLFYFILLHRVYKMTLCLITIAYYIFLFCFGGLIIAAEKHCLGKISMTQG